MDRYKTTGLSFGCLVTHGIHAFRDINTSLILAIRGAHPMGNLVVPFCSKQNGVCHPRPLTPALGAGGLGLLAWLC